MKVTGFFLPGVNNGLVRRFPSQRFEVLGKIQGADVGEHMRFQAFQIQVMKGFEGGIFNGAVHPLGLPVRSGVVRLGQLVHDAVFIANAPKDLHAKKGMNGLVTVLGQVGKSHPVVGEDGVNLVGKSVNHAA